MTTNMGGREGGETMKCTECMTNSVRWNDETTKTGLCDECLKREFPITSVCRLDLLDRLSPKDIGSLDDADMGSLAERMGEAYTGGMFWYDLEDIVEEILREK
jgi:hypothetical protein